MRRKHLSGIQPLVLSTRFLLQVGKGGRRRGAERRGAVAGRNRKEAGVKKHQKTAKSEGVEEAKADKSGKIIAKRSARSVFAVIISEKAACIVVHGVVGNNA